MAETKNKPGKVRCEKCGALVNAGFSFCSECGQTLSKSSAAAPPPVQTGRTELPADKADHSNEFAFRLPSGNREYLDGPFMNTFRIKPVGTPDKKRSRVYKKITPVILGVIMLLLILPFVISLFSDLSYGKFSVGEVVDNEYVNEWANVKLKIPDGWETGSASSIGLSEDEKKNVGLVLDGPAGSSFAIGFGRSLFDSESDALNSIRNDIEKAADQNSLRITGSEKGECTIAGEKFKSLTSEVSAYGATVYYKVYVRKQGTRVIWIMGTSGKVKYIDDVVSSIKEFK